MAHMYVATEPTCPIHGRMTWVHETRDIGSGLQLYVTNQFECRGFDGEGCGYVVTSQELDWQRVEEST